MCHPLYIGSLNCARNSCRRYRNMSSAMTLSRKFPDFEHLRQFLLLTSSHPRFGRAGEKKCDNFSPQIAHLLSDLLRRKWSEVSCMTCCGAARRRNKKKLSLSSIPKTPIAPILTTTRFHSWSKSQENGKNKAAMRKIRMNKSFSSSCWAAPWHWLWLSFFCRAGEPQQFRQFHFTTLCFVHTILRSEHKKSYFCGVQCSVRAQN